MLYKKFPITDIRKRLYITPEFLELNKELADKYGLKAEDFWDASKIYTNGMRIQINSQNTAMRDFIIEYGKQEYARQDKINGFLSGTIAPYQGKSTEVLFGTQYKFWGNQVYGMNQWPFMRASEMAYTEAEAAYRNGDEATARKILIEINKDKRDPNYDCTSSGEALLQEIKDYRTFELWGEGFNWFDMKRWHDPIVRVGWEAGNMESGNRGVSFTQRFDPDDFYGWVITVPTVEFNYADLPGGNR